MRIALVHDYLIQYGGAERVLESFCELFPNAPIYTLVHNQSALSKAFQKKEIITSFLQKIPFSRSEHHFFPVLMPMAIEQFDLSYYDVVLSDSSSYAKGVITKPNALHICYCHTPMRYAWDDCHKYTREFHLYPKIIKKLVPVGMNYIRLWDQMAAKRVDHFIANSRLVQKRIKKYYKTDSTVIHPPVFLENFQPLKKQPDSDQGYYLMVGRLVPYKKFDLGIQAFNRLKKKLKIVGSGPELKKLKKIAGPNIEFLGRLSSSGADLTRVYQKAKALIYPQEEDFGLVPLEAMACGRPVIAYGQGGATETVVSGKTGIFFHDQSPAGIIKAVHEFEKINFNPKIIANHAQSFSQKNFKKHILNFIQKHARDLK
ncbi:MAG: glycosyltransferase [Candidatus Moranbacteria bacterium]|nr:glycosyltransferase [Candidatus Moranbacteria bacterium]